MRRGISQHDDQAWMLFMPNEDVAAFAVIESTNTTVIQRKVIVQTRQYTAGDPRKTIWVNGPQDVAADTTGIATMALGYPAVALGSASAGAHVGPSDGSWELSTGYPGFVVIGSGPIDGTVVVIRQPEATICKGVTTGTTNGASTFTVDGVSALSGLVPVAGATNTLTVQNLPTMYLANNAAVMFVWNDSANQWEGWGGGSNNKQSLVTAVQVNTTSNTIDIKTRTLNGQWTNTESDWVTIHTGNTC